MPGYIFMITWNALEQQSYFKILKLRKNPKFTKSSTGDENVGSNNIEGTKSVMQE